MKQYTKILLIPVLLFATSASRAMADDEALAAVGGFIGGIIATKVYDHHRDHSRGKVIVVERSHPPGKAYGHKKHGSKHKSKHGCKHGAQYKTVYVREWVPGYWDVYRNHCGDRVREWVSGHYERVRKEVRVSCDCSDRDRRHFYEREYAYNHRR